MKAGTAHTGALDNATVIFRAAKTRTKDPLDSWRGSVRVASVPQYRVEVPRQMCGRFTNKLTWGEIVALYRLTDPAPTNLQPRYNIAPTQQVLTITDDDAGRHARMMRWGLIPHWAREPLKASTINARAETITEKPMWREPFRKRRCIIPADGFFEWKAEGNAKQPYRIERADGEPMSFAGVWDRNEAMGVTSCAIIVTEANASVAGIHDRMPVIIQHQDIDRWLAAPDLGLLKPFEGELRLFPVSKAVGNVRNDGPELIEPLSML